jgi:mono/diheme cytochrome c family protein
MKRLYIALLFSSSIALPVWAEQPQDFLATFSIQAKSDNAAFSGFDASRGEQLFKSNHDGDWSCSTCHTDNPAATGKHIVTKKDIEPLAPSANPERFTNATKVEKWFKRNCKDVLKRECTAQEKGDVLSYLLSLHK